MPFLNVLMRRIGDRRWDLFLRTTATAAVAGIALVSVFPETAPLVWLAVVAIPANSPLSPVVPTAFEPVIMHVSQYASVPNVTLVATAAYLYTEFLNWHLYRWVLSWERFQPLTGNRWVKTGMKWFARAPFATVVVFAFAPLPFWAARCLAILHRYNLAAFMLGTLIGRLPRFLLYAWLGAALNLPALVLASIAVGTAIIVIAWRLGKRKPLLGETALDRAAGGERRD